MTWTALLSRSRELTEKLTAKSRQTLQERDAAVEEKQQVQTRSGDCLGLVSSFQKAFLMSSLFPGLGFLPCGFGDYPGSFPVRWPWV